MLNAKSDTSFLIKNGRIVDPSQNLDFLGELKVEKGTITAVDKAGSMTEPGLPVYDAKGCLVLPGLIDVHVHLREPGQEYKETIESGTHAAVAGGFTAVACMANTMPVNDSPYVTAFIRERAKQTAWCRVFPIGAVSKGLKGEELAEIGGMVREGAHAISDDGMPVMNSYLMRKAMEYSKAFDVPVISHAEDQYLVGHGVMNQGALSTRLGLQGNPAAAEEIMVAREIALCRLTQCRVHIAHISTAVAVELVKRAKEEGLPITAEACPHHLFLTEEALRTYDASFKMAPPLRTEADRDALIGALKDGTVDLIATDHAPHGLIDKLREFDQAANGIIGLQTAAPLTYQLVEENKVPLKRWVEALTIKPAKLLNTELGTLKVGAPADITVLNPKSPWVFNEEVSQSKSVNSPFLGTKFNCKVQATFVGGKKAYESHSL